MSGRVLPNLFVLIVLALPVLLLSIHNPILLWMKKNNTPQMLSVLPYLFLGLGGLLSLKLNQRRVFFLAIYYTALAVFLERAMPVPLELFALALPLTLLALFAVPEGKLFGLSGGLWLSGITLPTAVLYGFFKFKPLVFLYLARWHPIIAIPRFVTPDAAILLAVIYAGTGFLYRDRYVRSFHHLAALSQLPLFYALRPNPGSFQVVLPVLSASILVIYGVFRLYWQKVYLDELTGIANRRALNERFQTLGNHYAIVMVDIDFFKKFNDVYGHDEGDNVLRFVAAHINARSGGCAYRYGGEEFTLVLESCSADKAARIAEEVRESLANRDFFIRSPKSVRQTTSERHRDPHSKKTFRIQITASFGVATPTEAASTPEAVVQAADGALYKAKKKGRNCVAMA